MFPVKNRPSQIKLRSNRIGAAAKDLLVLVEISLEKILEQIKAVDPAIVVIDSIQTVYSAELMSAPGSVGQVREASSRLILFSKKYGIPVFLDRSCDQRRFHCRS